MEATFEYKMKVESDILKFGKGAVAGGAARGTFDCGMQGSQLYHRVKTRYRIQEHHWPSFVRVI